MTATSSESADVVSLTTSRSGVRTAAGSAAWPICRAAPSTGRKRPAAFPQLFAVGAGLAGTLSGQREDRAERRGGRLPEGPCAGRRRSRRQLAARGVCPAIGRRPCRARQRRHRRDACPCDALRPLVGALGAPAAVAARRARRKAFSFRRRGPQPCPASHARPQPIFVTASPTRSDQLGDRLRRCGPHLAIESGKRRLPATPTFISADRPVSWRT